MKKTLWITLLVATLGASSAMADLVMKIDTANDTFYFEGSDSGHTDDGSGIHELSFNTANTYNFSVDEYFGNLDVCFEEAFFRSYIELWTANPAGPYFMNFSEITSLTAEGATGFASYGSLSPADQAVFESMIGDSLSVSEGTGYSDIQIQAVPEPATAGLLGISALVLYGLRRIKNFNRA